MRHGSHDLLARASRAAARIEDVLIAVFSLLALGLGSMQVILRYVFNTGFEWNESAFVLATIAAMLMAGVRAVREDRHVRVDILPGLVPAGLGRLMNILSVMASFALCAFLAWCGWVFVSFAKAMGTASPETGVPDWIVYSMMPIAMMLFAARYLLILLRGEEEVSSTHAPEHEALAHGRQGE